LIGWGWGVPHFSEMPADITTAAATLAQKTWKTKVRFRWCWRDGFSDLEASQNRKTVAQRTR